MSRLWDTPEFWARTEVDDLLRRYPERDVSALADWLERQPNGYARDPGFARDIVVELHKRAAAAIRFWPQPEGLAALDQEVMDALADVGIAGADEPVGYWWQRI